MEHSEKLHKALFAKTYSRAQNYKSSRNSGLVPTTLAEPTDSILSSPKQVPPEHFVVEQEVRLPTIVDEFLETSSEFVFEDEIDDEISKERFELSEEKRKIDMNRNIRLSKKVGLAGELENEAIPKKAKLESRDEVAGGRSSRQVARNPNIDGEEVTFTKRKRSNSRTSADSSKSRHGSVSKRVRKSSEVQVEATVKEEKIVCTKCKEMFDPSEFRRHNRIEHEFMCDQESCDYFLESDLALTNHKKKVHFIEPNHSYSSNWQMVCEACGKSIQGKAWETHKTTEHPFHCQVDSDPITGCFMRFLSEVQLNLHIKTAHGNVKTIPTKQSQLPEVKIIKIKKEASAKSDKTQNIKTCPAKPPAKCQAPLAIRPGSPMPSENYWVCHKCGDFFDTQARLDKHEVTWGAKHTHPCSESGCASMMCNKAMVLKHLWDAHGKQEKVHYCDVCQDVVDVKSWAAHFKRLHPAECGYQGCGAATVTNRLLWQHMIKKHHYGRLMNGLGEEEAVESEDEEIVDFSNSLDLDVDEIENEVIREEDTKSKGSVESFEFVEQVVEADEGEFIKCKVCELLMKRGKLQVHSAKVHKFKCILGCDLAFTQEHLMYNHCFVEHNNTDQISEKGYLVCPECSEFFEPCLRNSFELHVKNGKHETCLKCEKKFGSSRKEEFNFHCDYAHSTASDIPCPTCDLTFTSSDRKMLERHMQKKHVVGPCPHCKQLKGTSLLFVTKERFAKHHELEHSTSELLGCECLDKIARNVKAPYDVKNEFDVKFEDAYDLSEQITDGDESSIDEEIQFDYKNFKADEVSAAMKDSDPTDDCLQRYLDANPVSVKDELEADFPFKEDMNEKPVEVEISVQVAVDVADEKDQSKQSESGDIDLENPEHFQEQHFAGESLRVFAQNILEAPGVGNDLPVEAENLRHRGNDFETVTVTEDCPVEIQDNAVSTTDTLASPDDKVVPVEELIDSDPEVTSSHSQVDIGLSDDSKDSDLSHTDSENVGNLIGIQKQDETEDKPVEGEGDVEAFVNIAPDIKRETKNSIFNLVPYVDTDSDCESIEEFEKRTGGGKLAIQSASQEVGAVQAFKQEEVRDKSMGQQSEASAAQIYGNSFQNNEGVPSGSKPSPQPVLFRKTGNKVTVLKVPKGLTVSNTKLIPREVRSVSSDAQILCLEANMLNISPVKQLTKSEVEEPVGESHLVSKLDTDAIKLLNELDTQSSSKSSTLPDFGKYLGKEVSPSRGEISRALDRIRRISGENLQSAATGPGRQAMAGSPGLTFSFAGMGNKSPQRATGPPLGDCQAELVNFGTQSRPAGDEYTFPPEQGKTDQTELNSYQSLARPGRVSRKKPAKSVLSHETEETQMQADIARQQQEIKRINRSRQTVVGSVRAGQSATTLPGSSVLKSSQAASSSSSRQVPRLVSDQSQYQPTLYTSQPGVSTPAQLLPVLNTSMLRHMIPQDPMQFVTIPCSTQQQLSQSSKRPPTGLNRHNCDEKIADFEQPMTSSFESAPARNDTGATWHMAHNKAPLSVPRGGNQVRRSVENIDHSYVMEIDSQLEEDFDLSEKLEEMEKDFDKSEPGAGQEESLEAIKSLLDSQVKCQKSSEPNSSQGTISISDGEEAGLYSSGSGDDLKQGLSESILVLDDTISRNTSGVSINSGVSVEDNDSNLSFISDKRNVLGIELKTSPYKVQKTQDETYDDVDDLLGDSDDDEEEVEKRPVVLPIKPVALSEPSKKKPPQFVCPECHQKYGKNENAFNNHIRQKHNFPCKFCPLKFTYVNGLEEHSNSMHINETAEENSASFCCNICNKSFTRQGPYLKHKKRDHNIPCIECDMVFTNEPFLEEHMASMHGINSPPSGKMVKMRKPTSPVEVKFQLANGMINDSPKKIIPKQDATKDSNKTEKKDFDKKITPKMQIGKDTSKKGKPSKSTFKKMKDISVLSEDDTICEKCGQKFEELEAFEHHIERPHEHQCGMKNCELSFVYQYYLDLHIFLKHKTGIKPDERDRPIEESVKVAATTHNDIVMEDQISLADLAVSEDYLPGIGPQSMMCGGDPTKVKSLKGYKIPKKSFSPVNDDFDLSVDSSFNSSMSSQETTPTKLSFLFSPERNLLKCHQCDKSFSDRASFDQHISNHYDHGKNVLGSSSGSSSVPFKCYECNLSFKSRDELDSHVSSHYSPRQQSSSQGTSQTCPSKKLKCPLCVSYFEDMAKMMIHLKAKHHNGRSEKKHNFWCGLCRKGFETEKKFEDHEKLEHKYACKHCYKAYILEVDLNHHVEKNHNIQTKHKEGFTCKLCGENISEMEMFKIHQSQGHNHPCYFDGCEKRFQHKQELVTHLKSKHNIVQIRIGDDSDEEHRGYLTTERSQANIDIAEWAESWIDSPMAIDHMVKVMRGVVKSRRHDLFLDKRERDQCSGSETSRLYQLSNPGFLGGGGEKDTVVIKHLIDRVFMVHFKQAEQKLKELGTGSAFVYTSCVLFPETFIHQHQVQGKSREEAEQAFMEVAVDVEERKGLNQEIKEAAVRNRRDSDEDSGDEWVDHSDMEDDEED